MGEETELRGAADSRSHAENGKVASGKNWPIVPYTESLPSSFRLLAEKEKPA